MSLFVITALTVMIVYVYRLLVGVQKSLLSSRGKVSSSEQDKQWIEVVVDLWDTHLRHIREKATRYQRPGDFLYDPATMQFGFQQWSSSEESESDIESEAEIEDETMAMRGMEFQGCLSQQRATTGGTTKSTTV